MNIGVDIDEVLAELFESYLEYHNQRYGTKTQRKDLLSYSFQDIFGGTAEENQQKVLDFFKSEQFQNIRPVNGAVETVPKLAEKNPLHIITARPYIIQQETEQWLSKYFPNSFCDITLTNQWHGVGEKQLKSQVGKKHNIEIMIDDSLHHALDCASQGIYVLLADFGYPWNRAAQLPEKIKRVHSWKEIADEIEQYGRKNGK